jgi:hypothetical protein
VLEKSAAERPLTFSEKVSVSLAEEEAGEAGTAVHEEVGAVRSIVTASEVKVAAGELTPEAELTELAAKES